jgi:MFS family permease
MKGKRLISDSPATRWGVMLLVSVAMATNYYFYDALSPLKDLMHSRLGFSSSDYGLFMSAYSWPNVFLAMAIIGGIILDKIGIRITGSLFILLQVLGAAITAYGTTDYYINGGIGYDFMASFAPSWSPILKMTTLGFFIFGLGAETTIVVISKVIVKWFKGKELALALGLNLAIGRLGMAAALILSPRMVSETNISWPIWFSTMLLGIGFLAFMVYIMYDIKLDNQVQSRESLLDETEEFKFSDLGNLITNRSFIYITMLCVLFYSAVFPFVKFAPDLMSNKFGVSREDAGFITSILPFGTLFFTPLFAWICDFKGKSASLMIYGSLLLVMVHLLFTFTTLNPFITMFILGVAFSLVPAAMWPSVAKIVETNKIGTAYGLMFTVQNIGLMIFPILIGYVLDRSNPGVAETIASGGTAIYDYTNPTLMLAGLGVLGVIFALLLRHDDKTSGYGLELPNKVTEIPDEIVQK